MDTDKKFVLSIFPKDKSPISKHHVQRDMKLIYSDVEIKRLIDELVSSKHLTYEEFNEWYSITQKGLDELASDETGEEYIIRKLNENDGVFNLVSLDGNKFKGDSAKIVSIQRLESKRFIEKVKYSVGLKYMLTDVY
jgi:hypothetical protein